MLYNTRGKPSSLKWHGLSNVCKKIRFSVRLMSKFIQSELMSLQTQLSDHQSSKSSVDPLRKSQRNLLCSTYRNKKFRSITRLQRIPLFTEVKTISRKKQYCSDFLKSGLMATAKQSPEKFFRKSRSTWEGWSAKLISSASTLLILNLYLSKSLSKYRSQYLRLPQFQKASKLYLTLVLPPKLFWTQARFFSSQAQVNAHTP